MIKEKLKSWLGITHLEELERFTIAEVVSKLSENMVIITGDGNDMIGTNIVIPEDKNGLLFFDASNCTIRDCVIQSSNQKVKTDGN